MHNDTVNGTYTKTSEHLQWNNTAGYILEFQQYSDVWRIYKHTDGIDQAFYLADGFEEDRPENLTWLKHDSRK